MLGVIGNKFSIGKETYHPFSAELHYYRIDKRYWSICFERIRRAGYRIISTAVPWGIHQIRSGDVDFNGFDDPRRDLIVFLELAREFGFKVILRPGPAVGGQLPYNGLPKSLFADKKILARDSEGNEVKLPDELGVPGGLLPSYLHKNFQFHLRNYFKAFIETTKNYVHPRGPIFMVELDYETSFGRMLDPASADYNPDIIAEFWPTFLELLYEDVKKLNSQYKEKNASFEKVDPPTKFEKLELKHYPKIIDWFKFREFLLTEYLNVLEDIFKSYTVEPLFFRSLYFRKNDLLPAFNLVPEDRSPFLGSNVFPEGSYFDLVNKARFLKAEYGFAYATSFTSGKSAEDPKREERISPVENNHRRFYLTAGLSSGFKGYNQYMFVDRDHWYGAPLRNDGAVTEGFDLISNLNESLNTMGFEDMESKPEIAVVGNRMYQWMTLVEAKKDFAYLPRLNNETIVGICRDLLRLKLNYGIRENIDWSSMSDYKLLIVPSAEVMALDDQEALVELAKAGVSILLVGVMPRYDERFKDCQVLANHFRIKSTIDNRIGTLDLKNQEHPSYVFASLRTTDDSKVKKLVNADNKLVGVCSSRYSGNLYVFSYDISSGGNHHKLAYLESILEGEKLVPYLWCDDPSVDVSFQMGEKKGVLFVVVPPPGELSDGYESGEKEIIVQADLRQGGFSSANIKLTNLFDDEEAKPIRTTAKDLRSGMPLKVKLPDGAVFLVEKR